MKGNHNAEQHAWILLAHIHARLGNLDAAREGCARAAAIVPSKVDATVLGQLHATEALVALASGDAAAARVAADRAAASLWSLPPVMNMLIPHLSSLCEVYLGLLARRPRAEPGRRLAAARGARRLRRPAPLRARLPDRRADRRRSPGAARLARRARSAGGQALAGGAVGGRAARDALRTGAGGARARRARPGRRDRAARRPGARAVRRARRPGRPRNATATRPV